MQWFIGLRRRQCGYMIAVREQRTTTNVRRGGHRRPPPGTAGHMFIQPRINLLGNATQATHDARAVPSRRGKFVIGYWLSSLGSGSKSELDRSFRAVPSHATQLKNINLVSSSNTKVDPGFLIVVTYWKASLQPIVQNPGHRRVCLYHRSLEQGKCTNSPRPQSLSPGQRWLRYTTNQAKPNH